MQHVLPAPRPGVKREPDKHPDECDPTRDGKRFGFLDHDPPVMPNAPKRTTGSNMELGEFWRWSEHSPLCLQEPNKTGFRNACCVGCESAKTRWWRFWLIWLLCRRRIHRAAIITSLRNSLETASKCSACDANV